MYSLLGKLDLTLKKREDSLLAYRMEAEEGAREARALLAAAAAQHRRECGGNRGVSSNRPLLGSREGWVCRFVSTVDDLLVDDTP